MLLQMDMMLEPGPFRYYDLSHEIYRAYLSIIVVLYIVLPTYNISLPSLWSVPRLFYILNS